MFWLYLILGILVGVVALYYLINLIVAYFSLHPPARVPIYLSPGQLGLPQEIVDIKCDGNNLRGWWVPAEEPKLVVICLHGYIMNRCELVPMAPFFMEDNISSLHMDQRGQGSSGGRTVTFGRQEKHDVIAMIDWVKERRPGVPIVLFGSSMGAASCVFAAAERPGDVHALILDGVYRDLESAGKGWWMMVGGKALNDFLRPTVKLGAFLQGIKARDLSVEKDLVKLAGKPMLFLYGTHDPIVPKSEIEKNLTAAGSCASVEWFEGSGHGHGRFKEPYRYQKIVMGFLNSLIDQ